MSLYTLAENLSTPVYELREKMPVSEYLGWIEYFSRRQEDAKVAEERSKGNLLAGDSNDLIKGFGL